MSRETNAMRMLDETADRALTKLAIYLTPEEAREARDALASLLAAHERGRFAHHHLDDGEYEHHLTFVVYTPERAAEFQPRYRPLIIDDQ